MNGLTKTNSTDEHTSDWDLLQSKVTASINRGDGGISDVILLLEIFYFDY